MYIVVGSITMATRLARLIEKNAAVPAGVVHTPPAIRTGGCSYSVRVSEKSLSAVRGILSEFDIHVRGIYIEDFINGEREYRDIS